MFDHKVGVSMIVLRNLYGRLRGSNASKALSIENKSAGVISPYCVIIPYTQSILSVEIELSY